MRGSRSASVRKAAIPGDVYAHPFSAATTVVAEPVRAVSRKTATSPSPRIRRAPRARAIRAERPLASMTNGAAGAMRSLRSTTRTPIVAHGVEQGRVECGTADVPAVAEAG